MNIVLVAVRQVLELDHIMKHFDNTKSELKFRFTIVYFTNSNDE